MEPRMYLPQRPYSVIDAINRYAAATGSVRYAMLSSDASYNGHHVNVYYNDYRGYWLAEHYWGERVVHCRGSLEDCIHAAKREYDRGTRGQSAMWSVDLRKPYGEKTDGVPGIANRNGVRDEAHHAEVLKLLRSLGFVNEDEEKAHRATWYTWMHDKVGECASMDRWGLPGGTSTLVQAFQEGWKKEDWERNVKKKVDCYRT